VHIEGSESLIGEIRSVAIGSAGRGSLTGALVANPRLEPA